MVPTNAFAARSWLGRRARLCCLLGALFVSTVANAAESIGILSTSIEIQPLVARLASELRSNGYSVRFEPFDPARRCTSASGAPADSWISLAPDPEQPASVITTLCFGGAKLVTRGPRADPARFAVATAEALNGLRAKPLAIPERTLPGPESGALDQGAERRDTEAARSSLELAQALVIDPGGFPLLWGASLDAELAVSRSFSLVGGGFFPITRPELASSEVSLTTGVAFARAGAALHLATSTVVVSASLTAGPAFTWASADAEAPRVGGSASTVSAIGSAGLRLDYPARGQVFAAAQARASLLLPAIRFAVAGAEARTLGPALLETSLGVGLRL